MAQTNPGHERLNFYQLASIPGGFLGITVMLAGNGLAQRYGAGVAICSTIAGNLILWFIGMVVISMVPPGKLNAIENIKSYIGEWGGLFVALILMVAFVDWYALQINITVFELDNLFQMGSVKNGAALGLFCALISMGGIKTLRKIAVINLPILVGYHLYILGTSKMEVSFQGGWGLSLSAVITVVLFILPGMINLPTIFRYSHSKADAYLALSLIVIFAMFFEITSIWMNISKPPFLLELIALTIFIILSGTTCNLLNIYFASACWEAIVPRFGGAKGYAIIGLVGVAVYTFIQESSPARFFADIAIAYIGSLGIVLLSAFLMRILLKHRLRTSEKLMNGLSWLAGCIAATVFELHHADQGDQALIVGVVTSALFFLCVIFVEQIIWASKTIPSLKKLFRIK